MNQYAGLADDGGLQETFRADTFARLAVELHDAGRC
jgi:hypothetical protein